MQKNSILVLATLLMVPFMVQARSNTEVVQITCVGSNGVRISGEDSGQKEHGAVVLNVNTRWFGLAKSFIATSFFSAKPENELNITLRTIDINDRSGIYFLRGVANPDSRESQNVTMRIFKPGYAGINSPGELALVAIASCKLKLQ